MKKTNKVSETELNDIAGGQILEPEEFEWKPKGYSTPIKEDSTPKGGWKYGPVGKNENK